ncbi:MAG: MBL fold metallo-hydrolase [Eubacteriales bacterium]
MKIKKFNENAYGTNTYILCCEKSGLGAIIDPVGNKDNITSYIDTNSIAIKYILLTHGHFDHIQLVPDIKKITQGMICIHEKDFTMLQDESLNLSHLFGQPMMIEGDMALIDEQELPLGKHTIQVLYTPGHTKGSCCFIVKDFLFSGDTLFKGSVGRTDLPTGNHHTLMQSLKKICILDPQLKVFPGHGEETVLEEEIMNNPFISR